MAEPIYYLCISGSRVADLSAPKCLDMFWWEYTVSPVNENAASELRNPLLWQNANFTIVDESNQQPNPTTFSGGYGPFCDGETDRLSFRSLPPPT